MLIGLSRKENAGPDAEGLGELSDVHNRDIALAALDAADVVSMQTGLKTELFLRPALPLSEPPQPFTHLKFDICRSHGLTSHS